MTALAALLVAAVLVVSPEGPYTTIEAALAAAAPGDTIEVRGGTYGPLVVDRPVTLIGADGATIDGGGQGDVVRIAAPDVTLAGFTLRNSGRLLDQEHAGVTVEAPDAVVRDNVMREVLFGVFLKQADRGMVEGNDIRGYPFESARRGDGIRSWYSQGIVVRGNRVDVTRDVIFWFSNDATIEGNEVTNGRYGLHFMYDDGLVARGNRLRDNSVGVFAMYSSNVEIAENHIADSFGPSGYGVGLKELANVRVSDNVITGNRIGISFDTVPHGIDASATITDNTVAFNAFGLSFQPSTEHVELVGNSLVRNGAQIEVRGSGDLLGNVWTRERGNYWSDYVGYDADGDGLGDVVYEPRSLFDSLRDEHPILGFFDYSPAQQAVDLAARAVPDLQPSPKVVDHAPLMTMSAPAWFRPDPGAPGAWLATGAGLLGVAAVLSGALTRVAPRRRGGVPLEAMGATGVTEPIVGARGLTKRYGRALVLDGLDLEVAPGEAVALWGPNGAGKTTALKCLLGLIRCEGQLRIGGVDPHADLRSARALMGYVPQDLDLPDMPSRDLVAFFARIRGAPEERVAEVLELVGLAEHAGKRPGELSGGLRQRLALALALVGDPRVLLLDEPTANLDVESRHVVFRVLRDQRERGVSVLFTTHRLDEVVEMADRVVTLVAGRVAAQESAGDFTRSHRDRRGLLVQVAPENVGPALDALRAAGYTCEQRPDGWLVVSRAPLHEVVARLLAAEVPIVEAVPRGET